VKEISYKIDRCNICSSVWKINMDNELKYRTTPRVITFLCNCGAEIIIKYKRQINVENQ
jgi:hypothetical protein